MEFPSWSPNQGEFDSITDESIQMEILSFSESFEPQTRARSNTWPCPRPDNFSNNTADESESTKCSNLQLASSGAQAIASPNNVTSQKKNSSRRNAWGNLSYADLITQAIGSANENRLTLSQIYEWMVQNVPYFKDKGDSNSSAGWKNSIRHNLSLHNRFMRVQNEGTGKSSWWMLNPDAKPGIEGKSVRRRAASMETASKLEKRRGRAKKRVEALRNAGITGIAGLNEAAASPCSSVSEGLDLFPESPMHSGLHQLSPDFRQRASSNASSIGRLSPIPSIGVEPDWSYAGQDFSQNDTSNGISLSQSATLDQLAGSLADELTLQSEFLQQGYSNTSPMQNQQPPPPPPPYQPPQPYSIHATVAETYRIQPQQCPIHRRQQCTCMHNSRESMSPSYPNSEPSPDPMGIYKSTLQTSRLGNPANAVNGQTVINHTNHTNKEVPSTLMGQCMEALNNGTTSDDFEINLESLQGGLECNVEEVIQQELNIDGLLDINIPISNQNSMGSHHTNITQTSSIGTLSFPQNQSATTHPSIVQQYPQTSVTPPSWVH